MKQGLDSRILPALICSMAALALAACSGGAEKDVESITDMGLLDDDTGVVTGTLDEEGNTRSQGIVVEMLDGDIADDSEGGAIAPPAMTVYFAYDSVTVTPPHMELIERVAAHLSNKSSMRIRLEGHADERGTRTYNLALGERRAQSVVDMFLERGVLAEQMNWVSYGEEIPAVVGQDEAAWAKNRRVEIIVEE